MSSPSTIAVVTVISTGPTRGEVHFRPDHSSLSTHVNLDGLKPTISALEFEIHEFVVDYSLAPDVRCRSEYVGPIMSFGVLQGNLLSATTRDLFLHSIVLRAPGKATAISCGTIAPLSQPKFASIVNFKADIFGFLAVFQWQREW